MKRLISIFLVSASLAAPATHAGPITQERCPGSVAPPHVWKQMGTDLLENLLFADGSLWVSDSTTRRIVRLEPDGGQHGEGIDGIYPGGLAEGPDGLIYAGSGNSIPDALLDRGLSKVLRFDPTNPAGTVETYSEGFSMANGMTFGPNGDLFVSNDVNYGLVRIPLGETTPRPWELLADVWGTNGLVVDPEGENLYAAITFDQRSPIERVPLEAPASHEVAAVLTFGAVSLKPAVYMPDPTKPLIGLKGLDDMTRSEDGTLYVVANGMGELLKVDPLTGNACLVASGFQNPSSVRIAPPGSPFDTSGEALTFYIVEFSGAIRTVGYTPGT